MQPMPKTPTASRVAVGRVARGGGGLLLVLAFYTAFLLSPGVALWLLLLWSWGQRFRRRPGAP
jgi:hypothetical protein